MNKVTYIDTQKNTPESLINDILHDLQQSREAGEKFELLVCSVRTTGNEERIYQVAFTPMPTEHIYWVSHEIERQVDKLNPTVVP